MKNIFTKILCLVAVFCAHASLSFSQNGVGLQYTLSTSTLATFPTLGQVAIALGTRPVAVQDEWDTLIAPAGMSVNFAGVNYTKFVLSSNGWLALVPSTVASLPAVFTGNAFPSNSLSTWNTGYPIIAPIWDDLASTGIVYNWNTNSLWVRWTCKWDKANAAAAGSLMWVRIDGTTGQISFNYSNTTYTPSNASASMGIAGICTGDFYSFTPAAPSGATVTMDSTTENSTVALKPVNISYVLTPYVAFDNCTSPKDLGTITSSCTNFTWSNHFATAGSAMSCTAETKDNWFSFIKPVGVTAVRVATAGTTCGSAAGTTVEVFSSCGGASLGCSTTGTTFPTFGEVTIARPCAAETLYVKVTTDADAIGKYTICAVDAGILPTTGTTCANPTIICSLPFSGSATTAGSGNDYDSTSSACKNVSLNGNDYIFAYTPTSSGCINVTVTMSGAVGSVSINDGCPNSAGTNCLGDPAVSGGSYTYRGLAVTAGTTYYIIIDDADGTPENFNINVTSGGSAPANDLCGSATNLGSIPLGTSCVFNTYTTACATFTAGPPAPTCVPSLTPPAFIPGVTGDVWFSFSVSFTGTLQVNTQQSTTNTTTNAAMAIYTGNCGALSQYACDFNSGANAMPSLTIPVISGTTYYIRVWSENPETAGNFDICFSSACSPANDLPCSGVVIALGGTATGTNVCAGSNGEPGNSAQCVAGGTVNTVWYKVVVPASGSVKIRTQPLTLTDTQIQGFTFASGCANAASVSVSRGCNDDGVACSGGFNDFSEQAFTGLTPGDTLYIAVDGVGSLTGSFNIVAIDGNSSIYPGAPGQDCNSATQVCSRSSITVADPGWRNYGNICDLPSAYSCWGVGERNSTWYTFTVDPALSGGTASLTFDIFTLSSTDIDYIMWDITGLSNYCSTLTSIPTAACNYCGANSATGISNTPSSGCYTSAISFSGAPRTYLLLLNNWNSAPNAGYTLNWGNTPISSSGGTAVWTGSINNSWSGGASNWGQCGVNPSCANDALCVATGNGNQPTVTGTQSVKNLTIQNGATLTIAAGATLNVCGSFTNNGTLICQAGSTVQFIGPTNATISGSLTGANGFANLIINKQSSASVTLQSNIDVKENFTVSSAVSVFNINGKYMKVGRNFTNDSGNLTFTGYTASTVEFNGTVDQDFTNINGSLTLFNVFMNKTIGTRLNLTTANSSLIIDSLGGQLNLTSGIIVGPRPNGSQEVNVKNNSLTAIVNHNANSYVDGRLRRKIYANAPLSLPMAIPFPVGNQLSPGGYNLATLTYTSGTVIPDVVVYFNNWPSLPPPNGPVSLECNFADYSTQPLLNNGYWTFFKPSTSFNGNYNITLRNQGHTNAAGNGGFTVVRADINANPMTQASWGLLGNCVVGSTLLNTQRTSLNNPATSATSLNHLYATAMNLSPLPIELLYFSAQPNDEGMVICEWETATEINNDYFLIERSFNGYEFTPIGRVNGFGSGTTSIIHGYSFMDTDKCNNVRYYRLRQVDTDGKFSLSKSIVVNCKANNGEIDVYPNPVSSTLNCNFYEISEVNLQMTITDITGRIVKSDELTGRKGFNTVAVDVNDLPSGIYYIQLKDILNSDLVAPIRQTKFVKQ